MSTLIDEVYEQIDKLAKAAGKRAAARCLLRGESKTEAELTEIERTETAAVKTRLIARFDASGELPPIMTELVDMLPKTDTSSRQPVITITGRYNAAAPTIHVTHQQLADAVRKQLTDKRRPVEPV